MANTFNYYIVKYTTQIQLSIGAKPTLLYPASIVQLDINVPANHKFINNQTTGTPYRTEAEARRAPDYKAIADTFTQYKIQQQVEADNIARRKGLAQAPQQWDDVPRQEPEPTPAPAQPTSGGKNPRGNRGNSVAPTSVAQEAPAAVAEEPTPAATP